MPFHIDIGPQYQLNNFYWTEKWFQILHDGKQISESNALFKYSIMYRKRDHVVGFGEYSLGCNTKGDELVVQKILMNYAFTLAVFIMQHSWSLKM